jgi:large subunit ribosomal protein L29
MKTSATKAAELRRRGSEDLRAELARLSKETFERRFKGASEEKTDRGFVRRTRRDVARIRTVLRERELGRAAEPAATKE